MSVERNVPHASPDAAAGFYIAATTSLSERRPRTLKHGDTFALFNPHGDLVADRGSPDGLYHEDTRFLSYLRLTIEGQDPLLLSSTVQRDNAALDVDLMNPDLWTGDSISLPKDTIHIARMKFLWEAACYELISVRNFGDEVRRVRIALDFDADFADVFEVRGHTRKRRGDVTRRVAGGDCVIIEYASLDGMPRETALCFEPAPTRLSERRSIHELALHPKERQSIFVRVDCRIGHARADASFFVAMRSARRALRDASQRAAIVETSNSICNEVLSRSMADINMLITDTAQGPYPYAGVPWFSCVFGRDGLITAIEMLWADPSIARGVLGVLAANQATEEDPFKDAEPGKILHESRKCELARLGEVPFERYYGSIDSTPLFVILAGLYLRRTADRETLGAIWPNIKAALAWIDNHGDSDGDGFLDYRRRRDEGLANQGWKDSEDAVFHADGTLATAPVALCEVQGYVYLARKLAADMAAAMGEAALAARLGVQAQQLREQFEARFWDEALGTYVVALDADKRPCRIRTSNAGQLLFTGIASPERAARVAEQMLSAEFFSGWGVRTLSSYETRFNPASYHNGSIWPHDNALITLGLAKYGHSDKAIRVVTAMFEAAAEMDLRRLPELFCGTRRRSGKGPILYPIACAPQAWAAAAPMALLQACLGLEIDAAQRIVRLHHPRLPPLLDSIRIGHLVVGDACVDLLLHRRRGEDVAVNVTEREGDVEVVVML